MSYVPALAAAALFSWRLWAMLRPPPPAPPYDWSLDPGFLHCLHPRPQKGPA